MKETADGGIVHQRTDGQFCTMNINHWMVENCNHNDPAGSVGFIHVPPSVRPSCPTDVGPNWRYYHDRNEIVKPEIQVTCLSCCAMLEVSAEVVLNEQVSGVYKLSEMGVGDRPVYAREDGIFCILNINHWMIEKCDHQDKGGAIGFLHVPPGVQPDCPSDIGSNWRYFHDRGETVNPGIEVKCTSSPKSNTGEKVFSKFHLKYSGGDIVDRPTQLIFISYIY